MLKSFQVDRIDDELVLHLNFDFGVCTFSGLTPKEVTERMRRHYSYGFLEDHIGIIKCALQNRHDIYHQVSFGGNL